MKYCGNDNCNFESTNDNDLQFYNSNREDLTDEEGIKYLCKKCWNKFNEADLYLYEQMNISVKKLFWIDN